MTVVLEIKTEVDVTQAVAAQKELGAGVEANTEAVDGMTSSLDKMTGGAITSFRSIVKGAKSGVIAMTTLKGAIAATGIGLLIVAVGSLVAYFQSTQEGADKINQAFAVIGTTIDVLVDRLSTFGGGLVEIFNGNFNEGLDILAGSFKGVTEEIEKEGKASLQLEKDFQVLEKRKIDFIVTEKKLRAEIEASKLASEDFTKSVGERLDANTRATQLERQLATERTEQTKEELRIIRERNALGNSLNDDLENQRMLEAELFQIESDRDTRLKELVGKQRTLTDELQKQLDIQKEIDATNEFETLEPADAPELTPEQSLKVKQEEAMFAKLKEVNLEFKDFQEINTKEQADLEIARLERKEAILLDIKNKAFGAAFILAGKNAKAQQAIAASEATINTLVAMVGTLRAFATNPTPGLAIAQAIATGVFGFAQVASILQGGKGSTSSPSVSTSGGAIDSGEDTGSSIPNFDFANQGVGGNAGSELNRNFVILQDIKNQEVIRERITDLSKIA